MIRFLNQMIMQINPSDEAMKRMASRKCDSYWIMMFWNRSEIMVIVFYVRFLKADIERDDVTMRYG